MKWLFVFFLALNIAFFAWQVQRERHAKPPPTVEPAAEGERLLLLSEVKAPRPSAGAVPPARQAGTSASTMACSSLGAFTDREDAERVGEWFGAAGVPAEVRVSEQQQSADLIIHLTPEQSASAAQQRLAEVGALGIEDRAVAEVDGHPHTIVLGIYRDRLAAERRMAELRGAGLEAQISERARSKTEFWLDISENSEAPPTAIWGRVAKQYPELHHVQLRCGQIAPDQAIP